MAEIKKKFQFIMVLIKIIIKKTTTLIKIGAPVMIMFLK